MKRLFLCGMALVLWGGLASRGWAQFSGNLQGNVLDSSGAAVAGASLRLTSQATGVIQTTTSDVHGLFRFLSLAPGRYTLVARARGFAAYRGRLRLNTDQNLHVPVRLSVSAKLQTVHVTSRGPLLNTAGTRTQMTLGTHALSSLPLPGHSLLALVGLAPGVTGLGVASHGQPGQASDNFATETEVGVSANGRSNVGNMYVVDGLDVTSNITPGVLNLVPNPDTVQQVSVQVNTFSAEYGRASSLVTVMTTKSGTDHWHGLLSDYFTSQSLWAGNEFTNAAGKKYSPFHSNNISAYLGGPLPLHHTYFFVGLEPLRSSFATGNSSITFESPQFVQWAQQNFPNTLGTKLLAAYPASGATTTGVDKTASQYFGSSCGTAATANIPCGLPVLDNGIFNATNFRNGLQYNVRIDKYFHTDRLYGNYYQTTLNTGGPAVRVDMASPSNYITRSLQFNETHTLSPTVLNEAAFGYLRVEGLNHSTGPFHVPVVSIQGQNTGLGVGFAHEDFVQHHYQWRDVLTAIRGRHTLKFGYQGFHGDNITYFQDVFSHPSFSFTNLLNLVEDKPYNETSLAYNPLTGQPAGNQGGSFAYTGTSQGFFAQDNYQASSTLDIHYGIRWDDFGNPAPVNGSVLSDFFLGPGTSFSQQVANGYVKQASNSLNHAIYAFSPRLGIAWDVTGHGNTVLRGGFGVYHDWVTLGNQQMEFGNPPGWIAPTFYNNGTTAAPIFALGNSDTAPYGFPYPQLPATGLNSHGGLLGVQSNIGGIDPNLQASNTYNYTASLERRLGTNYVVSVIYSGSHSNNLPTAFASHTGNAYYGFDINNFPDSLIQNGGKLVRLNPNFGAIRYVFNGPTATYNALIATFQARVGAGSLNASYTRSSSWDDAQAYPTQNFTQYWAPSNWDVPNRLSLNYDYLLPRFRHLPLLNRIAGGWQVAGTVVLQSGTPFTVYTSAPFAPIFNSQGQVVGEKSNGGDFNADGNNYDFPNAPNSGYATSANRQTYLKGIFTKSDFPLPAFGTEGNELVNRFRNPGYADTDLALMKNNPIGEHANLQLRFEFYNLLNRPNLGGVSSNLASGSFGRVTSQLHPRWIQLGARFTF